MYKWMCLKQSLAQSYAVFSITKGPNVWNRELGLWVWMRSDQLIHFYQKMLKVCCIPGTGSGPGNPEMKEVPVLSSSLAGGGGQRSTLQPTIAIDLLQNNPRMREW